MKTIPGTALVEMGDEYAVERAVTHLNNVKLFGKRLNVWYVCIPYISIFLKYQYWSNNIQIVQHCSFSYYFAYLT